MLEKREFVVINDDGSIINCEALATYHHDENNKDYIVYTDGSITEEDNLRLYYSLYEEVNNNIKLIDITDIEDQEIGMQLVQAIIKKANSL